MSEETRPPSGRFDPHRLYWIAIAGIVLYVILDAIAQSLPPHYSPISDAESDLAVGPYGFIMTVNFLNRGLLSLAFVVAVRRSAGLYESRGSLRNGLVLSGAWGVGAILLALFPTDVPPTPTSWHGAIHLVVALVAFATGALGELVLSRQFGGIPVFARVERPAAALAWVSLLLLAVEFIAPFVAPRAAADFGGLLERLFLGSVLLWTLVVSASMVVPRPSGS